MTRAAVFLVLLFPSLAFADPITANNVQAIIKPLQEEVAELRKTIEAMRERDLRSSEWQVVYHDTKKMLGASYAQIHCGQHFPGSTAISFGAVPIPAGQSPQGAPFDADAILTFRCRLKP